MRWRAGPLTAEGGAIVSAVVEKGGLVFSLACEGGGMGHLLGAPLAFARVGMLIRGAPRLSLLPTRGDIKPLISRPALIHDMGERLRRDKRDESLRVSSRGRREGKWRDGEIWLEYRSKKMPISLLRNASA